jgi:lipid-A-disaccharide synthase
VTAGALDLALVIGEHSGDQLGFKLMRALRERLGRRVSFRGVAGPAMIAEGMDSLFPLDDIAVMGFGQVIRRYPVIRRRAFAVIDSILAQPPDGLVIIDSPDFTHAVAKRVRRRLPDLPVIDYVSPSVWAWRPGRARRMRAYVDHVLALLPFEPEAHRALGGPPCTYVGHPLIERLRELRPDAAETQRRQADPPVLLVLPGSRSGEVERLAPLFGEVVARLAAQLPPFEILVPSVPKQAQRLAALVRDWPAPAAVVVGEPAKLAAFRRARAALAASGTVTLELALSGVPMVGAYQVPAWEAAIARRLIRVPSVLLPNLVLGETAVPELLQEAATPDALAALLQPLILGGREREAQLTAFARLDEAMAVDGEAPSDRAARIVLETIAQRRQR